MVGRAGFEPATNGLKEREAAGIDTECSSIGAYVSLGSFLRLTASGLEPPGRVSRYGEVRRVSNLNLAGGRTNKKNRSSTPRALFSFGRRAVLSRRENGRYMRARLSQVP